MEIWKETHKVTQLLPKDEKFGIISQMNRSAASIPANIAEGASRDSQRDFNRFLQIALGSSYELETFMIGTSMLSYLKEDAVKELSGLVMEEQKMLMAFMKKLGNSTTN